jgi:hypothetical protein
MPCSSANRGVQLIIMLVVDTLYKNLCVTRKAICKTCYDCEETSHGNFTCKLKCQKAHQYCAAGNSADLTQSSQSTCRLNSHIFLVFFTQYNM